MQESERSGNPHLSGTYSRDRSIAEASRHVMRSTAFSAGMPGNCLLSDPVKGNAAALLVDRVARLAGVARLDEDGPRDALAAHMASASIREGKGMTTEWSPGWPHLQDDPMADVRGYVRKAFALDDRQLAAELLEQSRDARIRLAVDDGSSPQATALWQAVPAMALLFGGRLEAGEGRRFEQSVRDMNDQQAFELASGLVADVLHDGKGLQGRSATIGERALFGSLETGSTMVILLDRTARTLDADRGGELDLAGRVMAAMHERAGRPAIPTWQPEEASRRPHEAAIVAHVLAAPGY